jgi:hypothetical protein
MLDVLMTPEAIETPHLFDPDRVRSVRERVRVCVCV